MSTTTTLITVEEFLRLSEPALGHQELHHGEIVTTPPPKWGHRLLQQRIERIFQRLLGDRGLVMMEMPFRPRPEYEVWQADVGVVLAERANRTAGDEYLRGAPDLVVEVLSPGNTVDEIEDRLRVCLTNGCSSFWVVSDKRLEVEVTGIDLVSRHLSQSEQVKSELFRGSILVAEIFGHSN